MTDDELAHATDGYRRILAFGPNTRDLGLYVEDAFLDLYVADVASGRARTPIIALTANAMANMESLVEKYGAAPRAFLVVPIVGAFFIDFTNAIIITTFINWVR